MQDKWRNPFAILVAFGGGLLQFGLMFSDLSAAETVPTRLMAIAGIALAAGLALGVVVPARWPAWCLLASWGAIFWSGALLLMAEPLGLYVAPASLAGALIGGATGAALRRSGLLALSEQPKKNRA